MLQVALVVGVALIALGIGWYAQQRTPPAAPVPTRHILPEQLDRNDFVRPDAPWLVLVFTSATCETCAKVWTSTQLVESDQVAIENVAYQDRQDIHDRYAVTAVPSVVIADAQGVSRGEFLGPPTSAELWAKLAEVREAADAVVDGSTEAPAGGDA